MAIVAEKINLNELNGYEDAFLKIPHTFYGAPRTDRKEKREKRLFSLSTVLVAAPFVSYSGREQEDGTISECMRKYENLSTEANVSMATVGRAMSALKGREFIKKGSKASTYIFNQSLIGTTFDRLEKWVTRAIFHFIYKDKKGNVIREEWRSLTPSERVIFARFYTKCNNKKNKTSTFTTSASDISDALGLDFKTAQHAIAGLIACDLIAYVKKGVNAHRKSEFRLNMKLYREARRKAKKEEKEAGKTSGNAGTKNAKTVVNKDVESKNERTDFERWYASRRAEAEAPVDRLEKQVMKNPKYKKVAAELSEATREAAKADAFGLDTLPELQKKVDELTKQKQALLASMGLSEKDFIPKYHCEKCSDTGFLTDGRTCDCYRFYKKE